MTADRRRETGAKPYPHILSITVFLTAENVENAKF